MGVWTSVSIMLSFYAHTKAAYTSKTYMNTFFAGYYKVYVIDTFVCYIHESHSS